MNNPPNAPARPTALGRRPPPPGSAEDGPVRWGRLGLAALLGLVAGTVLFPSPARGREPAPPET